METQSKGIRLIYAHIEIVVTIAFWRFFRFFVIARNPPERFWQTLLESLPFNLPDLSKTSRTFKNHGKKQNVRDWFFRTTRKDNDHVHLHKRKLSAQLRKTKENRDLPKTNEKQHTLRKVQTRPTMFFLKPDHGVFLFFLIRKYISRYITIWKKEISN